MIQTKNFTPIMPFDFDYMEAVSIDGNGNPLIIDFKKGGSYDTGTSTYTGGIVVFKNYFYYDGSGNWIHTKVVS